VSPHCLDKDTTVLRDKVHIICHCPATQGVLQQFTAKFQGLTRLLDLPSFSSFTPDEKTRMVLCNPPPQVLPKGLNGWIMEATPICSEFAYALRMHVTSLLPICPPMMRLRCRLITTMISHLFYFHLVSNQRRRPQMTPYLYLLTPQDNR